MGLALYGLYLLSSGGGALDFGGGCDLGMASSALVLARPIGACFGWAMVAPRLIFGLRAAAASRFDGIVFARRGGGGWRMRM